MERRARINAFALLGALALWGCGDDVVVCEDTLSDAGILPTRLEVAEGMACASRNLPVPARETLSCGALPEGFSGARVGLSGTPGARWRLEIDRTDASGAVCAAVLDGDGCACIDSDCTDGSDIRPLVIDLGAVPSGELELMLGGGTYTVELCAFE